MANGGILRMRWSFHNVDKDPGIDDLRTVYQKQHVKEDHLAVVAGVATTTVKNMFGGKTRRPQHLTYTKLAAALGHEYVLRETQLLNWESEVPKALEERKQYRLLLQKKRERATKSRRRKATA